MCGIAGFYGFRDDNLIKKISKELKHRGPDGEGFYIDDNVTLLNRRLAIIDRKGGNQPIYNEDKSIVVSYNGEIYNYQDLREELEKSGHKFKTKSDTEVIVHGYEEWGEKCFDRFNGMFAIALYDIKNKKLILARDHFGIKPLYYALIANNSTDSVIRDTSLLRGSPPAGGIRFSESHLARDTCRMIFSSEIKPIINSGLIKKKPNDRIIFRYLKYRIHDDQRETFFEGVYKLLPGELLEVGSEKLEVKKYTNMEEELLKVGNADLRSLQEKDVNQFKQKLIEAVRLRLISEVPVGTCLSGGLDSSTIVTIVNKLLKEKVKEAESVGKIQKTFSAVFPGSSNDEEKYIDQLIKNLKFKIKNYKIYPKPEEFFKEMEDFVRTQEEPTISTGPYAQFKVMQEAHKHVTVVLDGQGADEMMAGYLPYYLVYLKQLLCDRRVLRFLEETWGAKDIIMNVLINQLIKTFRIKKEINIINLLNENFIQKNKKERFIVTQDNLKKRLIEDIFRNSLQSLLRYEDKNAMRFSIEGRVPFLDYNLLRYIFSLSDEAIIKNGWNKFILRKSVKDLLPELIVKRRNKIGFITPEYQWFMRMKNKIYQIFLSESFAKRKYFNQPEVLKAFQLFIEGKTNDTMLFWRMLNLEMWMRIFFDPKECLPRSGGLQPRTPEERAFGAGSNEGKKLEIEVEGKKYLRFPVKTDLIKKGDNIVEKVTSSTLQYNIKLKSSKEYGKLFGKKWFVVVSEKIVAIAQGRSYFIWDIKPGIWAKMLSNFVTKTPFGIGLGSPWTMQLAIREIGAIRVILAAIIAGITRPFGFKGVFYRITGDTIRSIDGPTEYSLYPSNVSAKLGPKNPEKIAKGIHEAILTVRDSATHFLGTVIIDANDLGQKVLGNSTNLPNSLIEKIFKDNPMGQSDEQTPIVIVFEK